MAADTDTTLIAITAQLDTIQSELRDLREQQFRNHQDTTARQKRTDDRLKGVSEDTVWTGLGVDLIQMGSMIALVLAIEIGAAIADTAPDWLKNAVTRAVGIANREQVENLGIGNMNTAQTSAGDLVASLALTQVGTEFRPGVSAQCAYFVHHVIEQALGQSVDAASGGGWDGDGGSYKGRAASFFFDQVSTRIPYRGIDDLKNLRPGDLVAFNNTYQNCDCITHVGIFVIAADGTPGIVDRPTRSAPVKFRPWYDLPWNVSYVARPHLYSRIAPTAQTGDRDWSNAIELIKGFEGFHSEPYWDYQQYTWGYGTRAPGASGYITREQAHAEMLDHLNSRYIPAVLKAAPNATQPQLDALLSWHYNTGQMGSHSKRDIYGALTRGVGVCAVIMSPDWMVVTANGTFLQGLENRRIAERKHSGCQ